MMTIPSILSLLFLPSVSLSELASCTGLPNSCLFPWTYENMVHTSCTTLDDPGKPWCATRLDEEGNMREWAYCADDCPGVANSSAYISPDNRPGHCCRCLLNTVWDNLTQSGNICLLPVFLILFTSQNIPLKHAYPQEITKKIPPFLLAETT